MKRLIKYSGMLGVVIASISCKSQKTDVPDYNATEYRGDSISLRTVFKGKVSVVNIWFIGCLPCMEEFPVLTSVYQKYKGRSDFSFYTIAANTESELDQFLDPQLDTTSIFRKVAIHFKIHEIKFPILTGINLDHKIEFRMRNGISKPIGLLNVDTAKANEIERAFHSNSFPTTIIYSKNGKEVVRSSGFDSNHQQEYKRLLEKKIDSLLML